MHELSAKTVRKEARGNGRMLEAETYYRRLKWKLAATKQAIRAIVRRSIEH